MHPLLQAADIIEAHIATLNNASGTCECCGHRRYENWQDHGDYDQLSGMVRKLRAWGNPDRKKTSPR